MAAVTPITATALASVTPSAAALTTPSKRVIAFVQLSFDGVCNYYTGVGTVVLQTQSLIAEMNRDPQQPYHIKSYLITACNPTFRYYSDPILEKNRAVCEQTGGKVVMLSHSTLNSPFATFPDWDRLCHEGAETCVEIIRQNTYTLIVAHDTTYAHVPMKIRKALATCSEIKSHRILWVPHGTGLLFQDKEERQRWELTAAQGANEGGYKIGYTGQYFKEHFQSPPFSMPSTSLEPYLLGILPDSYLEPLSEAQITPVLQTHSIPLDKMIIFSLGRSVIWKGHDITLELYRHLKQEHPELHLVLLAPPTSMLDYSSNLEKRINTEKLEVTFLLYCHRKHWTRICDILNRKTKEIQNGRWWSNQTMDCSTQD